MTTKEKYIAQEPEFQDRIPIFFHSLWMETVCGDDWDVVIYEVNNQIVAAMPYHIKKKYGIKAFINPKLTPYQGPWMLIPKDVSKTESKQSWIKKATKSLLNDLPSCDYFKVRCQPKFIDLQPFMWEGYQNKVCYTYQIASQSAEKVKKGLSAKTRNQIKSASKELTIQESDDTGLFLELVTETFHRQGLSVALGKDVYRNIFNTFYPLGKAKIRLGINDQGRPVAGIMTVSDSQFTYYLASGKSKSAHSGAVAMLIYDAICNSIKEGKTFDFEGSDIESIESFFRSFGGELTPYYQIHKSKNKLTDSALTLIGKL